MKIYLEKDDAEGVLRFSNIDLAALINESGHECIINTIPLLNSGEFDTFIPQTQDKYKDYLIVLNKLHTRGVMGTHRYINMLDKVIANATLEELGLNYLNAKVVTSREDIVNFSDEMVILKPRSGSNSKSPYSFAYKVMSKSDLLSEIDNSDIDFSAASYMIQEGVTNSHPIIWIGGYVNPEGRIHIDGILSQKFSINDKFFEEELRYPERYNTATEEVPLSEITALHEECIRQIKIVLEHFDAKHTPFCIQCIVDDDNEVQILDFNFGFGKTYALRARQDDHQYIIDRIKYTYGGADSIPPNTTYLMNCYVPTPNGITDEIKQYLNDNRIVFGLGQPDKDYVLGLPEDPIYVYHRAESRFIVIESTKQDAIQKIENFKLFLTTLP